MSSGVSTLPGVVSRAGVEASAAKPLGVVNRRGEREEGVAILPGERASAPALPGECGGGTLLGERGGTLTGERGNVPGERGGTLLGERGGAATLPGESGGLPGESGGLPGECGGLPGDRGTRAGDRGTLASKRDAGVATSSGTITWLGVSAGGTCPYTPEDC